MKFVSHDGALTATRVFHPTAEQRAQALSKFEAQQVIRELLRDSNRSTLVALYSLATGAEPHARMSDSDLFAPVDSAVGSGRILFTKGWSGQQRHDREKETGGAGSKPPAPKPDKPAARAPKETARVGVLAHFADGTPYTGRYLIKCADGQQREGTLDRDGAANVAGIAPGNCEISFPDLHGDEWRRA